MSHPECASYEDAKDWFSRECPADLQDKIAHVLTGDKAGEIDDTLLENQLLLRYLRDNVKLFEEVYDARFVASSCPSAVVMPSAENFIESFNQFIASPDLVAIKRLNMALNQFQQASGQTGVDFPKTLSALQANLDEIEKALEEAEKEKFTLQNNGTLIKERQNIADLEDELRGKEEEHKLATEFLTGLLRRKKTGRTEILGAERAIEKINGETENLKRRIKKAKVQLEKEELDLAPNSFQTKQTCENILRTMRQSFPELQQELNDFQAAVAKKIKSSAEKITAPISGSAMVYLCIRRQHEINGKIGADLDETSAREFAKLAVSSTAVDFDGLPPADAGFIAEYRAKLLSLNPREILKKTADGVLREFPFLNGVSVVSSLEELEHHFSGEPIISTQQIVVLIEYLRIEATGERETIAGGIGRQDLTALEHFVRNLEHIVTRKIAVEVLAGNPQKPWEKAAKTVSKKLYEPMADTDAKPAIIKKYLQKLPARGEHTENSHPSESGTDKFLKAIKGIIEFTVGAIKKVRKGGGGTGTAAEGTASRAVAEHAPDRH